MAQEAAGVSGMSIEDGAEQEDGPPALASLGSTPAPPRELPSVAALKREQQQQREQPKKKPVDINDMMHKARKAAENIRLLLHAKVCVLQQYSKLVCAAKREENTFRKKNKTFASMQV